MTPARRRRAGTAKTAASPARPEPRIIAIDAEGTTVPLAASRLVTLAREVLRAQRVPRAMLSITFLASRAMATLNRKHLGHRGATDVITFALGRDPGGVVVGDIYICPDVARTHAQAHGVGVREEIARLVVHGVLHACGLEHPEDAGRTSSPMWRRQEQLLKRFWTPATRRT